VTDDGGASASTSRTVTAAPANAAPTARFGLSCSGLVCGLDGSASADADGTIAQYQWELGDETTAAGKTAQHGYAQTGTYTIKLTVTDDDGASDTATTTVAPLLLVARTYRLKGLLAVELSWSRAPGGSYDIFRDGARIATVSAGTYTDSLRRGSGSHRYKVCQTGSSICSNQATAAF
jgi:serine protease